MVNIKQMQEAITYFLYCAPNISSVHSKKISPENQEALCRKLKYFNKIKFIQSNSKIYDHFEDNSLNCENICLKCYRGVLK